MPRRRHLFGLWNSLGKRHIFQPPMKSTSSIASDGYLRRYFDRGVNHIDILATPIGTGG